jgi:hypothetical protein
MSKYTPICSRSQLRQLCQDVLACSSLTDACEIVERFAAKLPAFTLVWHSKLGRHKRRACAWRRDLLKLAHGLRAGRVPFQILVCENSKLPFWQFSALPGFTCPGAGSCLL